MTKKSLVLLMISWGSSFAVVQSAVAADCPVDYQVVGRARVVADKLSETECYVSVGLDWPDESMLYRSYLLTSKGLMLVFNSLGDGPESTHTGAREFYFFPHTSDLGLRVIPETKRILVRMTNSDFAEFNSETGQIQGLKKGAVTVESRIAANNAGGVEISDYKMLILDSGFKLGSSPSGISSRKSVFRDQVGRSCEVKNTEIFKYVGGQNELKYSDKDLCQFLYSRCPSLTCNF